MPDASLIHADIFFFISTISLILITIGLVISFVYVVAILKNVRDITDKGRAEWAEIVADSRRFRASLRDEGSKLRGILDLAHAVIDKAHGTFERFAGMFSDKRPKLKRAKAKVK